MVQLNHKLVIQVLLELKIQAYQNIVSNLLFIKTIYQKLILHHYYMFYFHLFTKNSILKI